MTQTATGTARAVKQVPCKQIPQFSSVSESVAIAKFWQVIAGKNSAERKVCRDCEYCPFKTGHPI